MDKIFKLYLVMVITTLTGCASKPKQGPNQSDLPRVSSPAIQAVPVTPVEAPRVARLSQDPIPVYQSAKVRQVRMDAYINERGEAFGPSIKYVVEDAGGWNMDALRNPQQSYVPPSAALDIPTAPGTKYTTMSQSSSEPAGPKQGRFLYDLKDVKITGFTEMSQESRARAAAGPDDATIYDDSLGWVLVPKSIIRASGKALANRPKPAAKPKTNDSDDVGVTERKASDFEILDHTPKSAPKPLELEGELD